MNELRRIAITVALVSCFSAPLMAQAPNWSSPMQFPYAMGGDSGREAPAATILNGIVYMVYTTRILASGSDYYMYEATSRDGINYSSPTQINTANGPAVASSNPSLTVYRGVIYLAYNNSSGANIVSSANGAYWGAVQLLPTNVAVDYSPSVATDGTTLYVGLREHVASGVAPLVWCSYTISAGWSCMTNTSTGLNYGPNLTYYAGQMYVSFAYQGNSHVLLYYTWQNGYFSSVQSVTNATTSAAPGGAQSGFGLLYLGIYILDSL